MLSQPSYSWLAPPQPSLFWRLKVYGLKDNGTRPWWWYVRIHGHLLFEMEQFHSSYSVATSPLIKISNMSQIHRPEALPGQAIGFVFNWAHIFLILTFTYWFMCLLIYLCVCLCVGGGHAYYVMYVEVRGKLEGVDSLLLFLGLNNWTWVFGFF